MAGTSFPPADRRIGPPRVRACRIPTDAPEADGTLEWDATVIVLVELAAGGAAGLGYTYAAPATAAYIREALGPVVEGRDAFDIPGLHQAMLARVRNDGRPGIAAMAVSAVDVALWDLKARMLGLPLAGLLGRAQESVALYGSGGFTSYGDDRLAEQLGGWARAGFGAVKLKVGRDTLARDMERLAVARDAVGEGCALFVDANGAYDLALARDALHRFGAAGVRWFEEPLSSDDLAGLRALRDRCPPGMAIAAGEYGYDGWYFRRMLEAGAVDVLQADATRCGGITGFLRAAELARAHHLPISSHCAPALHLAACCATGHAAHMEWFHDHVRIERMLFDGAPEAREGRAAPDPRAPGLGLALRRDVVERTLIEAA